jgi:hypothetical protein
LGGRELQREIEVLEEVGLHKNVQMITKRGGRRQVRQGDQRLARTPTADERSASTSRSSTRRSTATARLRRRSCIRWSWVCAGCPNRERRSGRLSGGCCAPTFGAKPPLLRLGYCDGQRFRAFPKLDRKSACRVGPLYSHSPPIRAMLWNVRDTLGGAVMACPAMRGANPLTER